MKKLNKKSKFSRFIEPIGKVNKKFDINELKLVRGGASTNHVEFDGTYETDGPLSAK